MYYSYHTDNRSHHPAKRSGDYQCSIHRGTVETFTGRICKRALSAWIFAAVFSSVIANAVIGGTFLADSLKLGKTINDFWVKMFSSIIIALGACVGLIFGSNPIQLTIMAQGATISERLW